MNVRRRLAREQGQAFGDTCVWVEADAGTHAAAHAQTETAATVGAAMTALEGLSPLEEESSALPAPTDEELEQQMFEQALAMSMEAAAEEHVRPTAPPTSHELEALQVMPCNQNCVIKSDLDASQVELECGLITKEEYDSRYSHLQVEVQPVLCVNLLQYTVIYSLLHV